MFSTPFLFANPMNRELAELQNSIKNKQNTSKPNPALLANQNKVFSQPKKEIKPKEDKDNTTKKEIDSLNKVVNNVVVDDNIFRL